MVFAPRGGECLGLERINRIPAVCKHRWGYEWGLFLGVVYEMCVSGSETMVDMDMEMLLGGYGYGYGYEYGLML